MNRTLLVVLVLGVCGCKPSSSSQKAQATHASIVAPKSVVHHTNTAPAKVAVEPADEEFFKETTAHNGFSSSTGPTTRSYYNPIVGGGKTVHVDGHYRKDGTYVKPHTRSAPRK